MNLNVFTKRLKINDAISIRNKKTKKRKNDTGHTVIHNIIEYKEPCIAMKILRLLLTS